MRQGVVRLGVSLEPELLGALDAWVKARNSPSRSDAIRFLIRHELGARTLGDPQADAVGIVLVMYRHTRPQVQRRLTAAEHRWGGHVRSSVHVHLEEDACVEVIVLEGRRFEVEGAAEDLRGVKGIVYGEYLLVPPGVAGGRTGHAHPHPPTEGRRKRPSGGRSGGPASGRSS